jgi:hypothetical protein
MQSHRRPQRTLSNKAHSDNFNPADALESLHTRITELEAIAHAAGEAVTASRTPLPPPSVATSPASTPLSAESPTTPPPQLRAVPRLRRVEARCE